ncbi:MAG: hypothetical protein HY688_02565 [Chloroflexi bacterium]|nr:hypothetical protein [Chloroflexota bacterium]
MTEVDPQALGPAQWGQVGSTLLYLWAFVFFMGGVATNFLIAHAVIPSLITTRHLPTRFQLLRPFFYALTLAALGLLVWSVISFLHASDVLRSLYPKVWI